MLYKGLLMINHILNALLFSLAISFDNLATFFGYGISNIKVPFKRILLISILSTLILACGIAFGYLLSSVITSNVTKYISFAVLLLVGLIKLIVELIKIWLEKKVKQETSVIKIFNFSLFFKVALDPSLADLNDDKVLSLKESLLIGTVLSLDSLGVGLGSGMNISYPYFLIIFTFFIGLLFACIGNILGKKLSKKIKLNLSWLSGLLLILLAFLKLF